MDGTGGPAEVSAEGGWACRRSTWVTNLSIAAMGLALFAVVNARAGRIDVNDGLGWDGRQYAHMVTDRLVDGTIPTQTRPLLPLLTRIPYAAGLDVVSAFQLMNVLYAFVLYLALCMILDRDAVSAMHKAFFIATVALSIATSKMFAFYPTQIDLGALAVLTLAMAVVLTRPQWPGGVASLLAVAAREFNGALAVFAVHRRIRLGHSVLSSVAIYAPAVAVLFLIRQWAASTNVGARDSALFTLDSVRANLRLWGDPGFVAFFAYFLVTTLGGVTLLLASAPRVCARRVAAEPELATFSLLIVGAAAFGNADIWRYLVFLLPVIAMLYSRYARELKPGVAVLGLAFALTLVTQQPTTRMDLVTYFRDWFPAYPYLNLAEPVPDFVSTWAFRMSAAGVGVLALALAQHLETRRRLASG